ncbi:TPA: hypothetical protein JRX02_002912 [Elizabethkingia anophelis]|uniref:hypothetical protein n=1 Tax=Elizabethkingia anophelis TaxID=1117645 RepID=UPI0021A2E23A|nr:hypothetical protein [Elizabethkingia anophelis]MCT4054946.1 hypothetical protein [Elizabethkingia anophelis]HAY3504285.1 hypothetical protein [Elizabethkingia anophelis]HAY3512263.1 hypothetical protein [Elizabethkingia anophelis]HAY3516514.1 hypothetical protein [Elizabethkingia anophelis]
MWKFAIKWLKNELEKSDDNSNEIDKYRELIEVIKSKSQDDFEKYLYLLGSGGLVISLFIIEKVINLNVKEYSVFLLLISAFCFSATLLTNLLSHRKSISVSEELLDGLNLKGMALDDPCFLNIQVKGNKIINRLNNISIYSLIFGILFILAFFTINYSIMSKDKQLPTKPTTQPSPQSIPNEEKGRILPSPKITPKK